MSEAKAAFAARLNQALDQLGIPAKQHGRFTAIARLFGVSPVAARDWCEGKSYPSVDKLLTIMDTVHCGADWLLFGRAAPGAPGGRRGEREPEAGPAAGLQQSTAGAPAADAGSGALTIGTTAMVQTASACFAEGEWREVTGDAMSPTLEPGDRILCRPSATGQMTDGVVVVAAAGSADAEPLIRRLSRRLDGQFELGCDHPRHAERVSCRLLPDGHLSPADATGPLLVVLGWVVAVQRRLR